MADGDLNVTPEDVMRKMTELHLSREMAALEVMCEQSLVDPQGRGVMVHLLGGGGMHSPGNLSIELSPLVPYGTVRWVQHEAVWDTVMGSSVPEGE